MSRRQEFSRRTKLQAWDRCAGRCEDCGRKLFPGDIEYDHDIPCELGGDNSLSNCKCLCSGCHGAKTSQMDTPRITKARSVRAKHTGAHKPKFIMPGSRKSRFKKTLSGDVIDRATGRKV